MPNLAEINYFCESKDGTFLKDGQPFRSFLKQFYLNGGLPVVGFNDSAFKGSYACVNTAEAFTVSLDDFQRKGDSFNTLSYALIKKGVPSETPTQQASTQPYQNINQNKMAQSQQALSGMLGGMMVSGQNSVANNSLGSKMGVNMGDMNLVVNAIATKAPFGNQQGANVSTALYNGKDSQGCDLVSIEKSVANIPNSKRVYNYKACNGEVTALGETGLPGVPRKQELDPIIAQVKSSCKAYGAYGTDYHGTVIACKALDTHNCNLEINIMQNGSLIEKRVEKTCK